MTKKKLTFKESYEALKKNTKLPELQLKPDIDNLMKITEEPVFADKDCKTPVDTMQQALNETFKE